MKLANLNFNTTLFLVVIAFFGGICWMNLADELAALLPDGASLELGFLKLPGPIPPLCLLAAVLACLAGSIAWVRREFLREGDNAQALPVVESRPVTTGDVPETSDSLDVIQRRTLAQVASEEFCLIVKQLRLAASTFKEEQHARRFRKGKQEVLTDLSKTVDAALSRQWFCAGAARYIGFQRKKLALEELYAELENSRRELKRLIHRHSLDKSRLDEDEHEALYAELFVNVAVLLLDQSSALESVNRKCLEETLLLDVQSASSNAQG